VYEVAQVRAIRGGGEGTHMCVSESAGRQVAWQVVKRQVRVQCVAVCSKVRRCAGSRQCACCACGTVSKGGVV